MPSTRPDRSESVWDSERTLRTLERVTTKAARRRDALPAPQVLLRAPGLEFSSGDRTRRFHAASVGKMMTATLAFQLAERGELDLKAPLTTLLPSEDYAGLFIRDGVDAAAAVTPFQLLTQTSGVADYFDGPNDTGEPFAGRVTRDTGELFTPDKLVAFSRDHQKPTGNPGERFSYSDTGYVLLGRLIEEAGRSSLGAQLHARIFEPAGMEGSCLLFHTLPGGGAASTTDPGGELAIAPVYVNGVDLSRARSLSCDWGGGGVVTTLDDLHRFNTAWHGDHLVNPNSRERMTRMSHRLRTGIHYGAGVMELRYGEFFPLFRGIPRTTGHLGATGVHLFTNHARSITLAMNLHSDREMARSFELHIKLLHAVHRTMRQ